MSPKQIAKIRKAAQILSERLNMYYETPEELTQDTLNGRTAYLESLLEPECYHRRNSRCNDTFPAWFIRDAGVGRQANHPASCDKVSGVVNLTSEVSINAMD